ncbi:MAG: tRNA lysidine(34) synthetase TilS [Acidobacteriota bacterium]|nr:tRNA lysidine(34) synthetase TilS [Acidobacteriota bacterium]
MPEPALPFDRTSIHPGDRLCVALSGGADSVALLLTLHAANRTPRESLGIGLSAVHIHHGLRGAEADADQQFVEDLCARLDIPLHLHHASVPARLAQTRTAGEPETLEEAARNLRYKRFETLLQNSHADAVLTAHTLDDQAETVLIKLLRGAWTQGLSAIHPVLTLPKGKVLRPFLATRRAAIESFLTSLNQPWRTDSTNTDTAFTRNRIRHELLPQLRTYNPGIDQTLANLSDLAREEETRWQTELTRLLPHLLLPGKPVRGGGRAVSTAPGTSAVSIELERLRPLDPALRRRVLRAAAFQLGARLSFDETARLLALCGFQPYPTTGATTVAARTGSSLHLAHNLRAERSPRELRLFLQP